MKLLSYSLILAALFISSCATKQKISGEYDSLYYSPSDKPISQKSNSELLLTDTTVFLSNPKQTEPELKRDILSIGVGTGLDYGNAGFHGFGANLTVLPFRKVGIFYAIGGTPSLDISTIEYSTGIKYILWSYPTWSTEIVAMYGQNYRLDVIDAPEYDRAFPGFSFGVNENYRYRNFFLSLGLYVPILSEEAKKYRDDMNNNPDFILFQEPFPIQASMGIGFYFGYKEKHTK
jgi:hypothetical protein